MEPDRLNDENVRNVRALETSFERWRAGTGSPFDLLAAEVRWTNAGSSVVSKSYESKQQFVEEFVRPFSARLRSPLVPAVRGIYLDGDHVVALFDVRATANDGRPYDATYSWYVRMQDGAIVEVTSFFDANEFDAFWKRVSPAS